MHCKTTLQYYLFHLLNTKRTGYKILEVDFVEFHIISIIDFHTFFIHLM